MTRVNIDSHDDTSSQLTQYGLELLTATLAQLSSDMQTQGKFYQSSKCSCIVQIIHLAVPLFLLSNTALIRKVANLSCPPKVVSA